MPIRAFTNLSPTPPPVTIAESILRLLDAESLEHGLDGQLTDVAGILIPGGFGERGVEGKIRAAQFARENNVPYLGLCLGNAGGDDRVRAQRLRHRRCQQHVEFDAGSQHEPVICLLDEQRKVRKKGGSMRLGTWPTKIVSEHPGGKNLQAFDEVLERHRHRYEFNMKYREQMAEKGFLISGTSPDGSLAELIELRDHPCSFSPASTTRNSRANRTSRTRFSAASSAPASRTRISCPAARIRIKHPSS